MYIRLYFQSNAQSRDSNWHGYVRLQVVLHTTNTILKKVFNILKKSTFMVLYHFLHIVDLYFNISLSILVQEIFIDIAYCLICYKWQAIHNSTHHSELNVNDLQLIWCLFARIIISSRLISDLKRIAVSIYSMTLYPCSMTYFIVLQCNDTKYAIASVYRLYLQTYLSKLIKLTILCISHYITWWILWS